MAHPTRRDLLQTAAAGAAVWTLAPLTRLAAAPGVAYTLAPLPYAVDALEPHIDARTMEIHHDRHHQAYVNNLNAALNGSDLLGRPLPELLRQIEQVPEAVRQAVINNGGGTHNHDLFWSVMGPKGGKPPRKGPLAQALDAAFGSLDRFQEQFTDAALKRFGSGWAWLVLRPDQKLAVLSTANQDSPLMQGLVPLLGCDVWEHAYYLKYQNRRPDYVQAWWQVVNWPAVEERYQQARKQS
jgi:Fe-Mn family superoxide dismutase